MRSLYVFSLTLLTLFSVSSFAQLSLFNREFPVAETKEDNTEANKEECWDFSGEYLETLREIQRTHIWEGTFSNWELDSFQLNCLQKTIDAGNYLKNSQKYDHINRGLWTPGNK